MNFILVASGLKLVVEDRDVSAIEGTLQLLTDLFLHRSFGPAPSVEDIDEVKRLFESLIRCVPRLRAAYLPIPMPPEEWQAQMRYWIKSEADAAAASKPSAGRPPNRLYEHMLPYLFEFYLIAFGMAPAITEGGPTEKFLTAYISTVFKNLLNAQFELAADAEYLRGLWRPSTQEALRGRMRKAIKETRSHPDGTLTIVRLDFEQRRSRVKTS